jgi:hypothetical protein
MNMKVPVPILSRNNLSATHPSEGMVIPPAGPLEFGKGRVSLGSKIMNVAPIRYGESDQSGVAFIQSKVLCQNQNSFDVSCQVGLSGSPAGWAPTLFASMDTDLASQAFLAPGISPEDSHHELPPPRLAAVF